jgi:hypothetical protein
MKYSKLTQTMDKLWFLYSMCGLFRGVVFLSQVQRIVIKLQCCMLILVMASTIQMFCFVPLYFENNFPFRHAAEKKISLNTAYFGWVLMNESGQEMNEKWLFDLCFWCRIRSIAGQTIREWHSVLTILNGKVFTHHKNVTIRRIRKVHYCSHLYSVSASGIILLSSHSGFINIIYPEFDSYINSCMPLTDHLVKKGAVAL